jgi:hypothetical protein
VTVKPGQEPFMQSSARPPICPNCRGADVEGKQHQQPHHPGHTIGHVMGRVATAALWLFGKAVGVTEHQWKCKSCGHEFSPAPGSCGRCTATSDTAFETSCCHVKLCEACAADQERAASGGCLLCGHQDRSQKQAQEEKAARPRRATPNRAALYGFLTAFGLALLGFGLGYAGGHGWFLSDVIDRWHEQPVAGLDIVWRFLTGRLSAHPVQTAAQDAALPLFPLALVVCLRAFGMGWNRKALVGALVFVIACCAIRVLVWLFTWPATLFIDRIAGPEQGALVLGLSFGLWGVALAPAVWLLNRVWRGT